MNWRLLPLVAIAGAAGTLARFGLTSLVTRWAGEAFPWGTFLVNVGGSVLFGLVWGVADIKLADAVRPEVKAVALTGFLGAFTTFSTFAFETHRQLASGQPWMALASGAGQILLGVAAIAVGLTIARWFA